MRSSSSDRQCRPDGATRQCGRTVLRGREGRRIVGVQASYRPGCPSTRAGARPAAPTARALCDAWHRRADDGPESRRSGRPGRSAAARLIALGEVRSSRRGKSSSRGADRCAHSWPTARLPAGSPCKKSGAGGRVTLGRLTRSGRRVPSGADARFPSSFELRWIGIVSVSVRDRIVGSVVGGTSENGATAGAARTPLRRRRSRRIEGGTGRPSRRRHSGPHVRLDSNRLVHLFLDRRDERLALCGVNLDVRYAHERCRLHVPECRGGRLSRRTAAA